MIVSEVTLHQVQARRPGLICRKGVGGRYVAVTEFDPLGPVIAEGESPQDLDDEITRALARQDARDRAARQEASASGY